MSAHLSNWAYVFLNQFVVGNPNFGIVQAGIAVPPALVHRRIWCFAYGDEATFTENSVLQILFNSEVIDEIPMNIWQPFGHKQLTRFNNTTVAGFGLNARYAFNTATHGVPGVSNSVNVSVRADAMQIVSTDSIDGIHGHVFGLGIWCLSSNFLNPSYAEDNYA